MFAAYVGTGITAITGTYLDSDGDNSNSSAHRANLNLGTAFTGRRLVFCISWKGNNSRSILSVNLYDPDGVDPTLPCTIHLNQTNAAVVSPGIAIVSIENDTISGFYDVEVNYTGVTGLNSAFYISVYELTSCLASNGNIALTANAATSTVNASYGSYVVSVCSAYNITGTVSWTNATEDLEVATDGSSYKHVVAHESMSSSDATFDTTATASTSATYMRIGTYVFTPN